MSFFFKDRKPVLWRDEMARSGEGLRLRPRERPLCDELAIYYY